VSNTEPTRIQARSFARALDADDYEGIRPLLAASCVYETGKGTLTGPDAVIASYRENGQLARERFDGVAYESAVVEAGPSSATVEFTDHLTARGEHFTYRCRQRLRFDDTGRIVAITHVELPGERERLQAFCVRQGVP
jgi:ketosteroid isomerase-like protein